MTLPTIPPRDPTAPLEEEAARLRSILDGTLHRPSAIRMRRLSDGAGGWMRDYGIYPDFDPRVQFLAHWRNYSTVAQEDYGAPEAAYETACGLWLPEPDA